MKNIRLIAFSFNAIVSLVSAAGAGIVFGAENKAVPFTVNFRSDYKTNTNNGKESFYASSVVGLPFVQARWSSELYSRDNNQSQPYNYGVLLNTQKFFPVVPVVFMTGNLSASGSISRLNSPELSQSIGWSAPAVKTNPLKASLPQPLSFSKPQSFFVQAGTGDKKGFFKNMQINAFLNDEALTSSLDLMLGLFNKLDLNLNITGGIYPYGQSKQSSWFNDTPFYHEGKHFCCSSQVNLTGQKFSSLFLLNAYELPQGQLCFTYRGEAFIKFKHFSFNLKGYYNPNQRVITSSQKVLEPLLQLRQNSQYQFITGLKKPLIIKSGFGAQADIKLYSQEHIVKTNGGFHITSEKFNLYGAAKINLKISNKTEDLSVDFTGGSIENSLCGYIGPVKPELTARFSFVPDSKKEIWTYTEKAGINLIYSGPFYIKGGGNVTFVQKNGELKRTYSGVIDLKLKFDFVSAEVKINISGS